MRAKSSVGEPAEGLQVFTCDDAGGERATMPHAKEPAIAGRLGVGQGAALVRAHLVGESPLVLGLQEIGEERTVVHHRLAQVLG